MKMHHLISSVELVTATNAGHLSQTYQIIIGAIVFISTNNAQYMYFNNIYVVRQESNETGAIYIFFF